MKHLITIAMLLAAIIAADAQYYYPYDSSNYYLDDAPSLLIQNDPIMNSWYVSDLDGRRISDYYAQIRPYSQGAAAVRDHISWAGASSTSQADDFPTTTMPSTTSTKATPSSKTKSWAGPLSTVQAAASSTTTSKTPTPSTAE